MKKIRTGSVVDNAIAAAVTAQAGGRIGDAKDWCDAAAVADPSKAPKCADVGKAWLTHRQQVLTLEQARVQLQRKNFPEVDKLLQNLQNSPFPDIVDQALALARQEFLAGLPQNVQLGNQYLTLRVPEEASSRCKIALEANPSDPNALQCMQQAAQLKQAAADQNAWATIDGAKAQLAQGKRDEAAKTLAALLAQSVPPVSAAVKKSAQQALSQTQSGLSAFVNALRSPWITDFLAGLAIIAGLWIGLHLLRWTWRRILSLWARIGIVRWMIRRETGDKWTRQRIATSVLDQIGKIRWAFTGVQDDAKLGSFGCGPRRIAPCSK